MLDALPNVDLQLDVATMLAIPVAQHGHAHIIHVLDDYGAEWEEIDPSRGGPALMHAANNGHSAAVSALLECGADPEAIDFLGQTALMVAIFSDRAGAAEALLTGFSDGRQAYVDTEDDKGRTALSHAARYGSLDSIAVLAAHQADMFHEDTDGRTPLDIAEECGRLEAAMQLRRLQQRQRLRERREANKLAAAGAGHRSTNGRHWEADVQAREEQAAANAEALLAELEEDERRKAADTRARQAKKERRQDTKKKCPANGAPHSSQMPNGKPHTPNGRRANESSHTKDAVTEEEGVTVHLPPTPRTQPQAPSSTRLPPRRRKAGKGVLLDNHEASSANGDAFSSQDMSRQANGSSEQPHSPRSADEVSSSRKPAQQNGHASGDEEANGAAASPVAELRQRWDELLVEAASSTDPARQQALLPMVQEMAEQCAASGISIKYGKKVLGRLEKVGPARQELREAMQGGGEFKRLHAAVDEARGLRSLLQPEVLSRAETQLAALQKAEDARIAEQQAAALIASKAHPVFDAAAKPAEIILGNGVSGHAHYAPLPTRPALIHSHHPPRLPQRPMNPPRPAYRPPGQYSLFGGSGGGGGFPGVRLDAIASRQPSPKPLPMPVSSVSRSQPELPAFFPEALDHFPRITPSDGKAETDLAGGANGEECSVCMAAHREICCIPCGHVSMCSKCADDIKQLTGMCPLCRGPIQCLLRVPRASDWPQKAAAQRV
ncbi:hypothetical protein WJX73_002975 [Symbiochloris irregularis]|uniref:RING-type domain-containing protein n=1 Tax=Symbiochloris irregularis TaxID=706552 RepID=A0AAW1NMD1_9CHLO